MYNEPENDTIEIRLVRYERMLKLCLYLGGAIGGILVISGLSSSAIANAPWWLVSILIGLTVVCAALLGRAYAGYLSAQFHLVAHQKTEQLEGTQEIPKDADFKYPNGAFNFYRTAFVVLCISGLILLATLCFPPAPAANNQPAIVPPTQSTVPSVPPVVAP